MHIVIDIRALQIPISRDQAPNQALRGWLSAFLKTPFEHRVTLLVDPRFEMPVLDVPLNGSFWQSMRFESHPNIYASPNREAEQVACHQTNLFLLEQKADLFHLTSPFEVAIVVGYPPIACPTVATVHESSLRWPNHSPQAQEDLSAATSYAKVQALRYCNRIVSDSQSAADELLKLTNVPENRINLIYESLSPQEMALAMRETYHNVLTSPFRITSWGLESPTASHIPAADFGLTKLSQLAAQADVADRTYTVHSHLPLIGSHIASVRRHMTSHLREPYFDLIIERQVLFNKKLLEGLQAVSLLLAEYEQLVNLSGAQKDVPTLHPSQDIIDDASQTAPQYALLKPYLLAGPLPEYGDCLGRDFYERLYLATLSTMPQASEPQKAIHQGLLVALNRLAKKVEEYYEKSQELRLYRKKMRLTSRKILASIWPYLDEPLLREYRVKSDKSFVGHFIAWTRRHLTSHLREPYIDPIVEKQLSFNQLAVECVSDLQTTTPRRVKQLKADAQITLGSAVGYAATPIVGPIINWIQRESTSHLYEPYLRPIFNKQQVFNQRVADTLALISQKTNSIHLREHYQHLDRKKEFAVALREMKEKTFGDQNQSHQAHLGAQVAETELTSYSLRLLIEQMTSRIEERL